MKDKRHRISPRVETSTPVPPATGSRGHALAVAALAMLAFVLFFDLLFSGSRVVSILGSDLSAQFLAWRQFGFSELLRGNLPLWYPHSYSGLPFLAGFQSALFYPPNWLHLILPLTLAINWGVALHVFAVGLFMYGWMIWRGLPIVAAFLAAVMMMFSGAFYLHVYPGHLPNVCAMPWGILLFAFVDRWLERGDVRCLAGAAFAFGFQILAGHPQYVFYTAIGIVVFTALTLAASRRQSGKTIRGALGVAVALGTGAALAAVQLLPSFMIRGETLRGGRLPYEFVSAYSFPPENLLTLLLPAIYGSTVSGYWGRFLPWEMTFYVGGVALLLAVLGAWSRSGAQRWIPVAMVGVFTLLALGAYLPFHRVLYDFVSGFASFRGSSKFIYIASIFLAVLAAQGVDSLLRKPQLSRPTMTTFLAVCLVLLTGAGLVWVSGTSPGGMWTRFLTGLAQTPDARLVPEALADQSFVMGTWNEALKAMLLAALTLGGAALILLLVKDTRRAVAALVLLATAELFFFARTQRPSFTLEEARSPALRALLPGLPSDARVLQYQSGIYDSLATLQAGDGWGSDPMVLRRYAEFMKFTQGQSLESTTQDIAFSRPESPLYSLFRAHATIVSNQGAHHAVRLENPLPRLLIVPGYKQVAELSGVLEGLSAPDFDPRRLVLLEDEPSPRPDPATTGSARILREDSDTLEIEATLSGNGLLLITDSYSEGWHARPAGMKPAPQSEYRILPANYAFRAIPLAAGQHRLVVEYRAAGLLPGTLLSLLALGCIAFTTWKFRIRK